MEDFQRKFFYGSVYRECADSPLVTTFARYSMDLEQVGLFSVCRAQLCGAARGHQCILQVQQPGPGAGHLLPVPGGTGGCHRFRSHRPPLRPQGMHQMPSHS